jgi:hypothetical protein
MHDRRRLMISGALLVALIATTVASLGLASAKEAGDGPIAGQAEAYSLSTPVRDLAPDGGGDAAALAPSRINPLAGEADGGKRGTWSRDASAADPVGAGSRSAGRTPAFDLRFSGTGNPLGCGGCSPPDTIGDVGPNHYIQMVNATKVAIYNKTGTLLEPAFDLGDLWPSGNCAANAGDPVVLYDDIANRWLLSQFATPSHLCFAISQTANPRGAYHLFTFNVGSFPDYFKVGVWPNGYYVSANESTYTAYSFNRAKMLAGDLTASGRCRRGSEPGGERRRAVLHLQGQQLPWRGRSDRALPAQPGLRHAGRQHVHPHQHVRGRPVHLHGLRVLQLQLHQAAGHRPAGRCGERVADAPLRLASFRQPRGPGRELHRRRRRR